MSAAEPMRFSIDSTLAGAPDLAARLPVTATLLNRLWATDNNLQYWCARLDEPLRFHFPSDFDTSRCQTDYLDSDQDGPFLWVLVVALCVLPHRADLTSDPAGMDADLAYVVDNSLGYDTYLNRAKVEFAGVVHITPEPTSPHGQPARVGAVDSAQPDTSSSQPEADPAAAVFLDTEQHTLDDSDGVGRREPLAHNVDEFHTHLDRLVTELTAMAGRHPGLGPLLPHQFTDTTDTTEQTGYNLDDLPATYRSWEPRAGWNTRSTNDFDELLYWIVDDMARMLAWRLTVNAPSYPKVKPTRAQSILFFPYWRALVFAVDADWGERTAASIGELILSRGRPPGPDADHYFDALNTAAAAE
jgi:hypothetical protein